MMMMMMMITHIHTDGRTRGAKSRFARWRRNNDKRYVVSELLQPVRLKVGFHYPSSRPEFTGRVDGP